MPIVFHAPGTRGISPGYIFAPVGHRLNVLVRRRAPAALSIACPLSYCVGSIMDNVAVWCGYTPPTIGDCFSSPVHQHFTRSFKESIVLRLGLTCIRVWWGVFTPILNRLPLCSKSTVFPLQPMGCLNPTKSCEPRLARSRTQTWKQATKQGKS